MPIGLIFMRWNEISGNEVLAKYPEDLDIPDRTLMQIFHTHEYTGDPGMISLMAGTSNIASYYTGPETNYCIVIVLGVGEDADDYEGSLADVSQVLLQNTRNQEYLGLIPSLFKHIIEYPIYNTEQQLIYLYNNEIKRWIIDRLREEGTISKSQLTTWLKHTFTNGYVDIDLTLFEFVQKDLIQIHSIKNERSVILFFIKDLIIFRMPPFNIIQHATAKGLPDDLYETYKETCDSFFQNYIPSEKDNINIINILNDPQTYQVFNELRNSIINKSDIEKLENKGIKDMDNIIKTLLDSRIIISLKKSKGDQYYALLSDFFIKAFIPEYILDLVSKSYQNKTKSEYIIDKYLEILDQIYRESF